MNRRKVVSLLMTFCILGANSLIGNPKVFARAHKNIKPTQEAPIKRSAGSTLTVTHSAVVMSSPGRGYRICTLSSGTKVRSISDTLAYANGTQWHHISWSGGTGWVAEYLLYG